MGLKVRAEPLQRAIRRDLSPSHARALNNLTHWVYGAAAGAPYGLATRHRKSKLRYGLPFGAGVWASGYAVLPALGVYRPIWEYDLQTLGKDLEAHIVFGVATAGAFRALSNERREPWLLPTRSSRPYERAASAGSTDCPAIR